MEAFGTPDASLSEVTETDLGYIDILNPRSSYSEGKRICENLCICYKSEYNVPVKIVRLAQTVGAGIDYNDTRITAMFAKSVIENKDIVLKTHGNSKRQIIYTTDAVSAILTILLKGKSGECYTACNHNTFFSIKETAFMISEKIAEGKIGVKFNVQEKNNFAPDVIMNLSCKKLQDLGWKPRINLEESYRRLINSFENLRLYVK
ncbi:MAG: NAD-dependent epimerase/dehydratase family protein [Spirochaetia bacterium]|nr:NAD-dependent epimerase/dehydratase family protein [Spirochaetia bacterium]